MGVERYHDDYVAENHTAVDWMRTMEEVDDHMDEEVVEVCDRHLNK